MNSSVIAFAHPASILALEVFRLNGSLVAVGDALVAPLGLTSARWQVMGAVAEASGGLSVAGIARNMGLVRQSVQRIANELETTRLIRFAPNPHHRRAKLVQLTDHGLSVFESANALWIAYAESLMSGLETGEVKRATDVLKAVRHRLSPESEAAESDGTR